MVGVWGVVVFAIHEIYYKKIRWTQHIQAGRYVRAAHHHFIISQSLLYGQGHLAGGLWDGDEGLGVAGGELGGLAEEDDLGLFEVAPSVLVDQDQAQVVARRELLVHVAERRGQVEAAEEEADGDGLAA